MKKKNKQTNNRQNNRIYDNLITVLSHTLSLLYLSISLKKLLFCFFLWVEVKFRYNPLGWLSVIQSELGFTPSQKKKKKWLKYKLYPLNLILIHFSYLILLSFKGVLYITNLFNSSVPSNFNKIYPLKIFFLH